jgi:NTE family protein
MKLGDWLEKHPTVLALSSAFFGFYAHSGVAEALYEAGFRPAKVTGSSAGAIVGASLAAGLDPKEVKDLMFEVKREDFWDPGFGLGYLRGRKFLEKMKRHLPDSFHKTKFPVECAAFDLISMKTKFLNEGPLPASVVASCAVPFMFHPVRIGTQLLIDGGVFLKSGLNPADRNERVLCVYLESDRSFYERPAKFKNLGANQKVLRLKGLPQVLPHKLQTGREAFQQAYERTKHALSLPIAEMIEG